MINTDWKNLHADAFRNVRVLVSGGAGFIGSHLCDALTTLGANVVVLDDYSGSDGSNIAHLKNVEQIKASVTDTDAVNRAVRGAQYVFHLGAKVSVPASVANPEEYQSVNVQGTTNLLDAARKAGVKRVMFSASSSAYGESEVLPKVETMPPQSLSPYAASKVAGEQYIHAYASSYEIDAVSLRYFNIFGPRQNANSAYAGVIAAFARMLLAGEHPKITGDGSATRDFTFVHNAVHANLLAARHPTKIKGDVFNVATAKRISIMELATKMASLMGRPDLTPTCVAPRAGDVMHSLADLNKSRAKLGYEPIVDFDEGLKATVEWYQDSARNRSMAR